MTFFESRDWGQQKCRQRVKKLFDIHKVFFHYLLVRVRALMISTLTLFGKIYVIISWNKAIFGPKNHEIILSQVIEGPI